MPRRDGDRPDRAVVVAVRLAHGRGQTAHTDAVAAHDRVLERAVLIDVGHAHALGVLGAQLEDVAHLDAAGGVDALLAADRADAAVIRLGHVDVLHLAHLARDVEADVVHVGFVGAGGDGVQALQGRIVHHAHALGQALGADEARREAALQRDLRRMNLGLEVVAQLGLVDVQIAAQERDDVLVIQVLLIDDGLAGLLGRNLQERAQVVDGLDVRRLDLLKLRDLAGLAVHDAGGRLHVGTVVAVVAQDDGVLADRGEQHVLVGDLAAHHAAVGRDGDDVAHARAEEDAVVRVIADLVVALQILLGGVEGVRVLHGELAHADQAAAAARLVAELGLDLVDHEGILGVAVGHVAHEVHGGLLVGHAQHHVRAGAVGEAQQLAADGVVAAGLAPDRRGHGHREEQLLAVDAVHLLADDLLDLRGDALGDREQGVDAVSDGLDVAAAHHQRLAGDDAVGGGLLVALGDEVPELHVRSLLYVMSLAVCGGIKKAPPQIAGAKLSFAVPPCFSAEHAPRPCLPCIGSARQDFIARMAMRSPAYSGGRSGLRGLRAFQPWARSLESCGQIAFSVCVRLLLYPFDAGCASPIWTKFGEKGSPVSFCGNRAELMPFCSCAG